MGRPSKFDSEFRSHAVDLVRVSRKPRCQIAADLGVSDTTLSKWMIASDESGDRDDVLSVSEKAELVQLRAERKEWLMEREILKKGVAFWVREYHG